MNNVPAQDGDYLPVVDPATGKTTASTDFA